MAVKKWESLPAQIDCVNSSIALGPADEIRRRHLLDQDSKNQGRRDRVTFHLSEPLAHDRGLICRRGARYHHVPAELSGGEPKCGRVGNPIRV